MTGEAASYAALLEEELAAVTGLPAGELAPDAPFASFGLESLQAVAIAANLSRRLGRDVPVTLFFDCPTIAAFSAHLAGDGERAAPKATAKRAGTAEPMAIVGLALRLPGAASPDEFWENLRSGRDAISETPVDRWDWRAHSDLPALRWGGFVSDLDSFDHTLFRIPEPEAARMDPQQRLLLECVHEALESAHLNASAIDGSRTGVFVGISASDFSVRRARAGADASVFDATGNAHSIAANRISYLYNLRGPSLSLDTACSSSLVAFHEATKALESGECDRAIVAGVNVLLEPALSRAFAEAGMLSPDGRCRTFSAEANGYVRGEGVVALVLERAGDADASRTLAIARGSAVNHDGRTNGLTAPSGSAQEAVIREALRRAGLSPHEIDFVEAHGTGTSLGDPVEFHALARVFGGRKDRAPLRVGAGKAFVGHLEAAAGLAGLAKALLSLRQRQLPRQLHFARLNPQMEAPAREVRVADEALALGEGPLRAGISSFGFGGTNAHVILESAPPAPAEASDVAAPETIVLAFSATTPESLRELGLRFEQLIAREGEAAAPRLARSVAERMEYEERFAVWGKSSAEIAHGLKEWREGRPGAWASRRQGRTRPPRLAFAFTGQGSQFVGMGKELLAEGKSSARFAEILAHFEGYFPHPLHEVLSGRVPDAATLLARTDYGQALLFALELTLAERWEERGLKPELVFGHSLGELSAAAFAGVLSLPEAARLVAARGLLMQERCAEGAMLAVRGTRSAVEAALARHPAVEWAAINGPELFTLSGPSAAIAEAKRNLEAGGLAVRSLAVSRAFHSAAMEPMQKPFGEALTNLCFRTPRIPVLAGVHGKPYGPAELSSAYWLRQLREPTDFRAMVEGAAERGINVFLEIGPHGILSAMGPASAAATEWIPSLRRDEPQALLRAEAALALRGCFPRAVRPRGHQALPLTPFGHRRGARTENAPMANLTEELRGLVAGLLQISPAEVNPDANLVDLGADSLLLLNAIQTIRDRYGVSVAVADLFRELSTLRALAAYVEARRSAEKRGGAVSAEKRGEASLDPAGLRPAFQQAADPAGLRPAFQQAEDPAGLRPAFQQTPAPELAQIAALNRAALQAPAAGGDLAAIIRGQLELMNEQLRLLGGAPVAAAASTPLAAPPSVAPAIAQPTPSSVEAKGVLGQWRARANRETNSDEKSRAAYVESLITRFNARTARTKEHTQRFRRHLADNRVSAGFRPNLKEMIYTIVFREGKGSHFRDLDGNDYIDFTMGFGVNLFGHGPDFIEKRVRAQLDRGYCVGPQAELAGVVAEKACRVLGHERIAFLNSGTEAVMTALRLARTKTGRRRVVLFEGSYHGHADVVLARAGDGGQSAPVAPGVPPGLTGDVTVLAYGEASALEYIRTHGAELAAVLVEPVQSRYPEHQPADFLRELRKLTEQSGTALIFDEVICGLRVAPGGASELFGIRPDLAVYGKVLGGGLPIGAVAGKAPFLDPIDGGYWSFGDDSYPKAEMTFFAGTFCKHPLTLAAADAVLDRFLAEGTRLTGELTERTARLCERLNAELSGLDVRANHFGSLFRFKSAGNLDLFFANLNLRGAYVWEGRNLFLSTAHTEEDVDRFVGIVRDTVKELTAEGCLRKKP